jgi:hypothetical protein
MFYCWRCNGLNEECACPPQYAAARQELPPADIEHVRRAREDARQRAAVYAKASLKGGEKPCRS